MGETQRQINAFDLVPVCHAAVRQYQIVFGMPSGRTWDEYDDFSRQPLLESTQKGMDELFYGRDLTPEIQHGFWLDAMKKQGWTKGEKYSKTEMTHPGLDEFANIEYNRKRLSALYVAILKTILRPV